MERETVGVNVGSDSSRTCVKCGVLAPRWPDSELGDIPEFALDADSDATVADLVAQSMSPRLDTSRTEGTISITTKGWSLDDLINYSVQFRSVRRVSATKLSPKELDHEITRFEKEGLPLIIEGYHQREGWLKNEFGVGWLLQHGPQDVRTRNVRDWTDGTMKTKEFFEYCRTASPYGTSAEPSRFYGKDVDCPQEWRKWLTGGGVVPSRLLEDNSENFMSHLPIDDPVETLMCYFGIGDTFTPAHKDLCASTGHNLMCYTEKSGSSFWFMTESSAAPKVTKYFHDLGQELDLETHVVSLDEFSKAPFVIYIAEQKLGDLVLVPPRSCHQVVNHGGLTVKTSWSRMTLDGLKTAFYHELPIYRRVCRPEIYRVKSIVHHSLRHYTRRLRSILSAVHERNPSPSICAPSAGSETRFPTSSSRDVTAISRNTSTDTRSPTLCESRKCFQILSELLRLFDDILVEEYHPEHGKLEHVAPDSGNRLRWHHTCDFCGVDIFQSFFECRYCGSGSNEQGRVTGDGLIVCSSCYVEGRTCKCAHMTLAQRFNFDDLVEHRNEAARTLRAIAPEKGLTELSLDGSWKLVSGTKSKSLPVFQAGTVLHKLRTNTESGGKDKRMCTNRRSHSSHSVAALSVVGCKKCHAALCFEHLLEFGIHSATVFLERHGDDHSHDRWHHFHQTKKANFATQNQQARDAQTTGYPSRLDDCLVTAAADFDVCKPINHRWLKLGWYDKYVQGSDSLHRFIRIPVYKQVNAPRSPSLQGSPLTDVATTPEPDEAIPSIVLPELRVTDPRSGTLDNSGDIATSSTTTTLSGSLDNSDVTQHRRRGPKLVLDYVEIPSRKRKSTMLGAELRPRKKIKLPVVSEVPNGRLALGPPSANPLSTTDDARQPSSSSQLMRRPAVTLTSLFVQQCASGPSAELWSPSSRRDRITFSKQPSSAPLEQVAPKGRRRKGHPGIKAKEIAMLPSDNVLTLRSPQHASSTPFRHGSSNSEVSLETMERNSSSIRIPGRKTLNRNAQLSPALMDTNSDTMPTACETRSIPGTDRISRAQSLQFLPGRQPEDTIVSHTSIATQTIVTDVNHASLTSSEGHTASTGPILVQGSTADAIVSCLMEKLQEINNGLEERTGQCEDMFEKLQLLKLLTEITRYLRLSEFEQRSNASHATASADSDIRTTQDTSTKLEMFAEKMKSIETLEHANLAKIKALEENSKDMEKRFRVFETGISSRHAELASQPGQFCQFHVLGTVHALGSDQTHPAQHEVSLHANPRGPSNRGRQYSWTDNRGAGAPYSRKQSDGQSSNQPYYHNGRSNTYSQRRSGPPTGPRYRAGERQSQYHRNQHYHHHRDVNKPSRCGRDEYNDGLVRSRVDDPKNCQQHATASRSRSTSIVQLNSQQDGRTHEQPEEQGRSGLENENWEDHYAHEDDLTAESPSTGLTNFTPNKTATCNEGMKNHGARITQDSRGDGPEYYITNPEANPWQ